MPVGLLLFPAAIAFALHAPGTSELAGGESNRRILANIGQALYAWLMICGLMGLFRALLNRHRPWVRYMSDSSYWLYLVHLPLIIAGQVLLKNVDLPAMLKLTVLIVLATVVLLVSYQFLVRHTWIGQLLNGTRAPRNRSITTAEKVV